MCANGIERAGARGFTLLELILILVMVGTLAVFVLPRLNSNSVSGGVFRDQVASTLRHAQKTATSHRRLVCAGISPATLSLRIATSQGALSCNQALPLADGGATLQSKNGSTNIAPAPLTLYFKPDGRVGLSAGSGTNNDVVLSVGGLQVEIVGETGHVR